MMTVSEKLRLVKGLRSQAEMFGFNWDDGPDWTWRDVARKIADEIDDENAKLYKLMQDTYDCICEMYRYMDGRYACEDAEDDDAYGPILKRMRDFGIDAK